MLLHKFISSSGHIATTSDGSGGNLPKEEGPWQQFASQVVNADDTPNVGTSSLDILADVKADGFSLFPRKKGISQREEGDVGGGRRPAYAKIHARRPRSSPTQSLRTP